MQANKFIVEPVSMPSNAHDLDLCLSTMVKGFRDVISKLDRKPVAISFAFPDPADYPNGIIGGYLPNFPSFRNGVVSTIPRGYVRNSGIYKQRRRPLRIRRSSRRRFA